MSYGFDIMLVLKYIGIIVLIIIDIVIIGAVLFQTSNSDGLSGLVSGGSDTFFGRNNSDDPQTKLKKITKIAGIVFVIVSILLTTLINRGNV